MPAAGGGAARRRGGARAWLSEVAFALLAVDGAYKARKVVIDSRRLPACRHRADHGGAADPLLPFRASARARARPPSSCHRLMIATTKQALDYFNEQDDAQKEQ